MVIEMPVDIAEEIADKIGVYGEERCLFISNLSERIRAATDSERLIYPLITIAFQPGQVDSPKAITLLKTSDKEKIMEVRELVRIVHLADAVEVICNETGMSIPDCLERLKGVDGLRSDECEQIKLYHMKEIRI